MKFDSLVYAIIAASLFGMSAPYAWCLGAVCNFGGDEIIGRPLDIYSFLSWHDYSAHDHVLAENEYDECRDCGNYK